MEACYGWVQNLVGFFLFMTVIDNLLPGKSYRKYIRLFAGTVLILLVLKPLTGGLRLEEAIARAYESFVFQYQADDLQEELLGMEAKRLEQMIRQYEEAVAVDVEQIAAEEQLTVLDCQVTIDGDDQSETYGQVIEIQMMVAGTENGREGGSDEAGDWEASEESRGGNQIKPVEKVKIEGPGEETVEPVKIGKAEEKAEAAEKMEDGGADPASGLPHSELSGRILRLRRRLETYYDLEERYVEIQIAKG